MTHEKDTLSAGAASTNWYDDDVEDEFIPYAERPNWKDIVPLAQNTVTPHVFVIDYSPRFVDCFNYIRAVMQIGEKSLRVLDLTADAIQLNAANYTVWQYRRDVLQALNIPCKMTTDGLSAEFEDEFLFSLDTIETNQKNYQVWHHRKILVQWAAGYNDETEEIALDTSEARDRLLMQEIELTTIFLNKDAKNYHAWQHRQWILNTFNSFEEELEFVDKLLKEDVRNNSAWNQRHFVITKLGDITPEVVQREVDYTWAHILVAPHNESSWSYLEGVFRLHKDVTLGDHKIIKLCESLGYTHMESVPLLSFMITTYEQRIYAGNERETACHNAMKICDILATRHDKIRSSYWNSIKGKFSAMGINVNVD